MSMMGSAAIIGLGASAYASANAAGKASKSMGNSEALQTAQLLAAQQQQAKWEATYGKTAENLGKYYNSLTPEDLVSKGLTGLSQAYNNARNQTQGSLAQRGLTGSGIEQGDINNLNLGEARDKANLAFQAPQQLANAQQAFLNSGGGINGAQSGNAQVSQATSNLASSNMNLADLNLQTGAGYSKLLGSAVGTLGSGTPSTGGVPSTTGTYIEPTMIPSAGNTSIPSINPTQQINPSFNYSSMMPASSINNLQG